MHRASREKVNARSSHATDQFSKPDQGGRVRGAGIGPDRGSVGPGSAGYTKAGQPGEDQYRHHLPQWTNPNRSSWRVRHLVWNVGRQRGDYSYTIRSDGLSFECWRITILPDQRDVSEWDWRGTEWRAFVFRSGHRPLFAWP